LDVGKRASLVVLVVGESDSGKSTLCTYLGNTALARGIAPCVIDGDIGQGDIAPPASVGSAILSVPVTDLRDTTSSRFEFIGAISPVGIEYLISETLRSLSEMSRRTNKLTIVNTDGYVQDGGLAYKRLIADRVNPDIIVLLGENQSLFDELESGSWHLVQASSSDQAIKTRLERQWRRRDQFYRFIGEGENVASLPNITFDYLGHRFPSERLLSNLQIDNPSYLEGLFVGLSLNDSLRGFGVIRSIGSRSIRIRTDLDEFDTVHLSNVKLTGQVAEQVNLGLPGHAYREN
jgi:polynucleotide 5'-hydroxyl-kinase GRC3/NOL9